MTTSAARTGYSFLFPNVAHQPILRTLVRAMRAAHEETMRATQAANEVTMRAKQAKNEEERRVHLTFHEASMKAIQGSQTELRMERMASEAAQHKRGRWGE